MLHRRYEGGPSKKPNFCKTSNIDFLQDGKYFGWEIENLPSHDWSSMAKNLSEQLNSRSFEYQKNLRDSGIEYIQGWARLKNNHEITVTNAEGENVEKSSKTFIIATGSRHQYLEIQGNFALFWKFEKTFLDRNNALEIVGIPQ